MNFRRVAKWIGIVLLIVASVRTYAYCYDHYIVQNFNNMVLPSREVAQRLFSETYPSRIEIEDYLHDATILISYPPISSVYYFDNERRFITWHGNYFTRGHWYLYPMVAKRMLDGRSRFDLAYTFCRELNDGSFTEDNCVLLGSTQQIMAYGRKEYGKGDIFELSKRDDPPFDMPKTNISIDELRRSIPPMTGMR
jgi:hypothetical protein